MFSMSLTITISNFKQIVYAYINLETILFADFSNFKMDKINNLTKLNKKYGSKI